MKNRTLSILVGALCIGAAAVVAFFSQETQAQTMVPHGTEAPAPLPGDSDAPGTMIGQAAEGDFRKSGGPIAAVAGDHRDDELVGATKGIIRGDIQLAVSVLDRLGSINVIVEEARNAFADRGGFTRPKRYVVPVERGIGTPTFEVRDVEFSEYPYTVTVYAAGLNGSSSTVVVDRDHPRVEDVLLRITPGAPFSILLRDQDGQAHPDVLVDLLPVGTPHGRPRHQGTSDNFGSVVFENVLAGGYELVASTGGQRLIEPQQVTIAAGEMVKVQGQGHVVTIPRGLPLDLQISDTVGYGIQDAKVTAVLTDRRKLTEVTLTTDPIGRVHFPHLQPGVWQITIEREQFQRIDMNVTLKADEPPEQRNVRMVRSRRM
ncbi:MAG: carboxypeptidase regulatory-like domain-containing protein [Planctomycetes bacterium]|nr:carboxypeptidase regulatory-like domain-containing protein [Planctomycetota bacterium]